MKKIFLTRRNALLTSESLSWGSLVLSIIVLLVGVRLLAPNLFWQISAPLFRTATTIAESSQLFFSSFGDRAALLVSNENLGKENMILALENRTLRDKIASYDILLDTPVSKSATRILAEVIARPPISSYDTLLIEKGSRSGVSVGMEVFALPNDTSRTSGVPIGFISQTTKDFSQATLFSSPNTEIAAWVGSKKIPLMVNGFGGGVLYATIARTADVQIDDIVYSPGQNSIGIGKVVRLDDDPSLPSVVVHIMPFINPYSITTVLLSDVGAQFLGATTFASSTAL